jgi:hypothetical protein
MSYYERNAERIKAKRRQRYHEKEKEACQKIVPCEICRTGLTKCAMNKHLKTQKHAANLQARNNPPPKPAKKKLSREDQEVQEILKRVSQERKERKRRGEYVSAFMP